MAKSANSTDTETVENIQEETVKEEVTQEETVQDDVQVYIVESPVKGFCGIAAAGVNFAYGKAEIKEGWILDWYRNHGYTVTKKD